MLENYGLSIVWDTRTEGDPMKKPNYQFEKRKRELEKKQKKAEKAQGKIAVVEDAPATEIASESGTTPLPEQD